MSNGMVGSGNGPVPGRPTIWLVGCFGLNGPLRQYFSLYRAVSQREGERKEKRQMREKMSKQPPPAPTASAIGPCPTIIQTSRTPRHWKFTQHLRSTRPPPYNLDDSRAKAYYACNRCGWGLFGHFNSPLSFLFLFLPLSGRGGRVVRWCWVNLQCRGALQF